MFIDSYVIDIALELTIAMPIIKYPPIIIPFPSTWSIAVFALAIQLLV